MSYLITEILLTLIFFGAEWLRHEIPAGFVEVHKSDGGV